jgi:hypothetical protein
MGNSLRSLLIMVSDIKKVVKVLPKNKMDKYHSKLHDILAEMVQE